MASGPLANETPSIIGLKPNLNEILFKKKEKGFDGHPLNGRGWPANPLYIFYKNRNEGVAIETPRL